MSRKPSYLRNYVSADTPQWSPARAGLLDLVPGRSAAALTRWLADRDQSFRDRVEVVAMEAMDGFGGYKNAATADSKPSAATPSASAT